MPIEQLSNPENFEFSFPYRLIVSEQGWEKDESLPISAGTQSIYLYQT